MLEWASISSSNDLVAESRPKQNPATRQFGVADELILVATRVIGAVEGEDGEPENLAFALNGSGRAIWELCNGERSVSDIVDLLARQFDIEPHVLSRQVSQAVVSLSRQGLLDGVLEHTRASTDMTFVIGIEDKPYFWWQTAIFLESFSGKLPAGWQTHVVVCNDDAPLSPALRDIFSTYDTRHSQSTNHAVTHRIDVGHKGGQPYAALNKLEALRVASQNIDPEDMICLIDSDMFLYGDIPLEIMPTRCALAKSWHVNADLFFSTVAKNQGKGVDLTKLLEALGCSRQLSPGGVNVFVTGEVARSEKFVADCFRFADALLLLGRAAGLEETWIAEMPSFALAMTINGIDYELLERKEFLVSDCDEAEIPSGTLYHYYSDPRDFGRSAFRGSAWYKQAYYDLDFLRTDFEEFARNATTAHEKYFFDLANAARSRLDAGR
jgi:hypothetical protein